MTSAAVWNFMGESVGREPMGVKARSLRSGTLASRSRTVLTLLRGSFLETQDMNHPMRYLGNDPGAYEAALLDLFRKYPSVAFGVFDHASRNRED